MFYKFSKRLINRNLDIKLVTSKLSVALSLLWSLCSPIFASPKEIEAPPFTVGLLQIVAHPALDKTQKGIIDGLQKAHSNVRIIVKIAQGNILNATMISQKFIGENVDAIAVLGTSGAQAAAKAAYATKTPVVFASITDPLGAKLVQSLDQPGGHVTGVSNYTAQTPQLLYFKELIPNLETIGFIYNPGEANSVTLLEKTIEAARELNISIIPVAVTKTTEVSMATQRLISRKVDAIFINNDNTALAAFDVIAQLCQSAKLPLFVSDTDMVKQGALGALGPDQYALGLQCAAILSEILAGKNPKDIPVQFPAKTERYLNMEVAGKIALTFPKEKLKKIDKILFEKS
ncbi:MAG: ABC transporter substrate-binding protein [Alphaproteobacteria bacterium]|nr:ABC transporter substrate-binding protein [Alphaproteobacteria bacterium]NCQ67306.1 ABC transporter substrate-binding protein [Alphaproteobacteria bacterium]NCT06727.1 ABC transporter substrate-binding protein [Alphaproteobacteria bacterium]